MSATRRLLTSDELSQLSPTFSRVLRERRIAADRAVAAKRIESRRPRTRIERALVSQLGAEARLLLLCGGEIPTEEGYPRTTIVDDERDVIVMPAGESGRLEVGQ